MVTPEDEIFLRRALRLAMNGRGHVEPNPMVGCVLVKNGQIVGEGWHQKVGEAHAEPNALADCVARGNSPDGATAYVTLEPCCHTNKRTPPCAPRLIEAKVARVVVGCLDPNLNVNGQGVAMLRDAGIVVEALPDLPGTGVPPVILPPSQSGRSGADEPSRAGRPCHDVLDASHFRQLIAPFIAGTERNDRYLTAKWAETRDGRVSGPNAARLAISNVGTSRLVHELRSRCDAIVVGIGTVFADDPLLTPRDVPMLRVPERVVLDASLRLPIDSRLVRSACDVPTTVICDGVGHRNDPGFAQRAAALRAAGVIVDEGVPVREGVLDFWHTFQMGRLQMTAKTHVLIEPGPTLARSLLPFCDRIWVIRSSTVASPHGLLSPTVPAEFIPTGTLNLAGDTLTEYLNTRSGAFFAAVPSADFVLAAESAARAAN